MLCFWCTMRRRIVLLLLLAAACAAGVALWYSRHASFTSEGLAAYAAAARLDPLFAIEGTDPEALRHAVSEFFALYGQAVARYPSDEQAKLKALYPSEFLHLLPELEAARLGLLAAPTALSARSYHGLLVRAMRAYADDAQAIAALMRTTASEHSRTAYMAGDARLADLADKLEAAGAQVVSVQLAKEQTRFACLRDARQCAPPAALLAQRAGAIPQPARPAAPGADAAKAARLTQQLNSLHYSYTATEPVLFAIDSTCVASSTTAYVQAYYLGNHHGAGRKLSYVHDAYFYDMAMLHATLPERPIWGALLDAGVAWLYQNAGNAYECPDAGYDQTEVGSLLGALEWLRANATSAEAGRILSLETVSKADMAPYIKEKAAVDSPETNALVGRYMQGSADFNQVVLGALNDNGFLLSSTTAADMPSYAFVIATRNYASTLFLMGNPTFIPRPQSLFSAHAPQGLGQFFLRSYLYDLQKTVSGATLVAQYKKSLDIQFPTTP